MKKVKTLAFMLLGIILFVLTGLFLIGYFQPKKAGLNVYANVESEVFVNGELVGKTPLKYTLEAKEIVLKVVPSLLQSSYETKLSLIPGVETAVRRDFEADIFGSSGENVSFEKTGTADASFAVVSVPDVAQITVDNVIRGFAPLKLTLSPGDHQVVISLPGYKDRSFDIRTKSGYKLTAVVELAKTVPDRNTSEEIVKKVQILSTPNGFLRVRETASTTSAELAQVRPGETFNFQEENSFWYKIEYAEGKSGWISSEFAEIIETSN